MSDIKIFIITHKETYIPEHPLFFPIQVGSALTPHILPDMLHDHTGTNISEKNRSYCELTAQYWAWKNSNADYYGFFHYRRYLDLSKTYPVNKGKIKALHWCPYYEQAEIPSNLSTLGLTDSNIRALTKSYDVITNLSEHMDVSAYEQFCQFHDKHDLDIALSILKKLYPQMTNICDSYMNSKYIYFCNLYIMKKKYFFDYMEWLFPILEEFEAGKDFSTCNDQEMRITGYLAERLFGVYYTWLKQQPNIACCEVQTAIFRQNIRDFYIGKSKRKITINMNRLNRVLPAGSLRRRCIRRLFRKDLT